MIVAPRNPEEWRDMARFLHERALVRPSPDLKLMGWLSEGKLVIVVGFNGWIGSVVQMHVAYAPGWNFTPRAMLREVFRYVFDTAKRSMVLGIVNSNNERAMNMDRHLGFTELLRLDGAHDDGGDLVVLGMRRDQCRYLLPEFSEVAA